MDRIKQKLDANRKVIVRNVLIGAAVVTTVVVVAALYKTHVEAETALELATDLA